MYLDSEFHRYWARCGSQPLHPDDAPSLANSPFQHDYLPCPFDGPLHRARVVICLANPNYPTEGGDYKTLILDQRSGESELPKAWDYYYEPRIAAPLGLDMDHVRSLVSVLNVCPYASTLMEDVHQRAAAGLASVWQAQKFLREVLLPRALTGNIYLLVIRKHQLWGITEGPNCRTVGIIRGHEIWGGLPKVRAKDVRAWLEAKRLLA